VNVKKLFLVASVLAVFLNFSALGQPTDWKQPGVHVVAIDGHDIPNSVSFTIDRDPAPSCPAGNFLWWFGQGADTLTQQKNVEAAFSLLLAAKLSQNVVDVYGLFPPSGGSNCKVVILQLR
jgi:hypothetical protein